MQWPPKDPDDVLDFSIDWSEVLESDGLVGTPDTIATVTWTLPAGITKGSQAEALGIATVWISGGTIGSKYDVHCRMVSAGGRTYDRTVTLPVRRA